MRLQENHGLQNSRLGGGKPYLVTGLLGPVFALLFQQSTDTGEIRMEWSLANDCPLFKKSDRSFACNYNVDT